MACNNILRHSYFSISSSFAYKIGSFNGKNVNNWKYNKICLYKAFNPQNYYSSVLFNKEKNRANYVKPVDKVFISAAFLSQGTKDAFQVVVTNPSVPSAELSSSVSSIEEVSKVLSESGSHVSTSDIAATLSDHVQTVAQFAEPSLASLGLANYTPVGLIQVILEYLHINAQMPWWMAIAVATVFARILLLPILIKTQRNTLNMGNHMPQLQFLQARFGEARRSGNTMEASRFAQEIVMFMKDHNISPIKNALLPMAQAPVFISFFMGLRAMAKAPVESMKEGGLWWVTDLTIPDPYYILPVISCSTLYIVLKIGAESGVKLENMKMARYFLQALPVVALPFCINFPAAVLYYWVTTNFCTLAIVSVLRLPPVRKYLNLPQQQAIDPKFIMPKKSFVGGMKEAWEDQKALSAAEDRRRMDEIRFQKAGTGPIPRTYSYDPTKVRPSNVAAAANKSRQSMSAKEHKT